MTFEVGDVIWTTGGTRAVVVEIPNKARVVIYYPLSGCFNRAKTARVVGLWSPTSKRAEKWRDDTVEKALSLWRGIKRG